MKFQGQHSPVFSLQMESLPKTRWCFHLLPDNQINKVVLAADGYLYVATENGFARSRKTLDDLAIP